MQRLQRVKPLRYPPAKSDWREVIFSALQKGVVLTIYFSPHLVDSGSELMIFIFSPPWPKF